MSKDNLAVDYWGDGMRIFLSYIQRQLKKNPDYNPHPLIRALELAIYNIDKVSDGERIIGVSQDGTEDKVYNPFIVVLKKHSDDSIEVEKLLNIQVNKVLPLDVMIMTFRLQIHLDTIPGDTITPYQMADVLNAVIPGNNFYALGDRWKEARDLLADNLKAGKVALPRNIATEKLTEDLLKIKESTPWEEYSSRARAFIGSQIAPKLNGGTASVIITSPKNLPIEKYKAFDTATEFLLGKSSEYFNSLDKFRGQSSSESKE